MKQPTKLRCDNGHEFTEPEAGTYSERDANYHAWRCPRCRSLDVEVLPVCPECGEPVYEGEPTATEGGTVYHLACWVGEEAA